MTATGCQNSMTNQGPGRQPTVDQVARMPAKPNIVRAAAFYHPFNPWIWTEDKSRPRGLIVSAFYMIGPSGKGVFGDGIIHPKMYVLKQAEAGRFEPVLAREWTFSVEEMLQSAEKPLRDHVIEIISHQPRDRDLRTRNFDAGNTEKREDGRLRQRRSPRRRPRPKREDD